MSLQTSTHSQAVENERGQLMEMLLHFSPIELTNLRRLLQKAEQIKRNGSHDMKLPQRKRRFVDAEDGGPVWELGFAEVFDRASCYERIEGEE